MQGKKVVDIDNVVISKNGDRKRKCCRQGFLEWLATFLSKFTKNDQDQGVDLSSLKTLSEGSGMKLQKKGATMWMKITAFKLGGIFRAQSNIYHGTFLLKLLNVFLQKNSIVDVQMGSKLVLKLAEYNFNICLMLFEFKLIFSLWSLATRDIFLYLKFILHVLCLTCGKQ